MTRLFSTDDLSNVMARSSLLHTNVKLTVNPWCHISIAFKCKLAHYDEDLFDLDEHDTIDALQAGHSRATKNQIYGLSPDALAGAAEDVLPLFLEVNTKWQVSMHTVPGGLGLPYGSAKSAAFHDLLKSGRLVPNKPTNLMDQPTANLMTASEERIVEQVSKRLEEKLFNNLEDCLVAKLVSTIGPMIQSAIKTSMDNHAAVIPFSEVEQDVMATSMVTTVTNEIPTNLEDMSMDDLYESLPRPCRASGKHLT